MPVQLIILFELLLQRLLTSGVLSAAKVPQHVQIVLFMTHPHHDSWFPLGLLRLPKQS